MTAECKRQTDRVVVECDCVC